MKIDESLFGSDDFKALNVYNQSEFILLHQELLDELSAQGLEMLATILIKAQCRCKFYEVVLDESTGQYVALTKGKHIKKCPVTRNLTIEDYSVNTQKRRQLVELLFTNNDLIVLEESSSKPRKKSRYSSE
jgi:hypothetical protein